MINPKWGALSGAGLGLNYTGPPQWSARASIAQRGVVGRAVLLGRDDEEELANCERSHSTT